MYNLANRLQLVADFFKGRHRLRSRPFHLTIESTNKCNLRCPMCNREKDPLPLGHMPLQRFRSIIDQNRGTLEFIWPFGEGEPMLNKDIYSMISYAKQSRVSVELSTNATMLDEERGRRLIESGLDHLILAFDGASKESYEKYRTGATFEKVRANIERFLELRRRLGGRLRVVLQMVLLRDNQHEVGLFRKMWKRPGVDGLRFKEDQLKYGELRSDLYQIQNDRRRLPCFLLWRGPMFIRHDGTVTPCCRFAGREPLGDLKKQSFEEFWNSEAMQKIRQAHVSGDLGDYEPCQNCTIPRPNRFFTLMSMLAGPLLIARLLPYLERLHLLGRLRVFQDSYGEREAGAGS